MIIVQTDTKLMLLVYASNLEEAVDKIEKQGYKIFNAWRVDGIIK